MKKRETLQFFILAQIKEERNKLGAMSRGREFIEELGEPEQRRKGLVAPGGAGSGTTGGQSTDVEETCSTSNMML